MTDEVNGGRHISVSMPVGALATVLVIALAGFAYTFLLREDEEGENAGRPKPKGSIRRKVGLKTLIAVIENDTSRRLLLAVLRALARRG
jgi:hypothetical protein